MHWTGENNNEGYFSEGSHAGVYGGEKLIIVKGQQLKWPLAKYR